MIQQLTYSHLIDQRGNEYFCNPNFSEKLLLLVTLSPLGLVGNAIFILISGYFMVEKKPDQIDISSIAIKLLSQLFVAICVLMIGSNVLHMLFPNTSFTLLTFNEINSMNWFVGYYFLVMVIARVFLQGWLSRVDKKTHAILCICLFALVQFSWSRGVLDGTIGGAPDLCTGIFLYSLGGYIRKYNPFGRLKMRDVVIVLVFLFVLIYMNFYTATQNAIINYDPNSGRFIQSLPGYSNVQFIPLCMGIVIFEIFRRVRIGYSKVINYVGSATLMMYLLHDNNFVRGLFHKTDWITMLHDDIPRFMLVLGVWTVGICMAGVVVYAMYGVLANMVRRRWEA